MPETRVDVSHNVRFHDIASSGEKRKALDGVSLPSASIEDSTGKKQSHDSIAMYLRWRLDCIRPSMRGFLSPSQVRGPPLVRVPTETSPLWILLSPNHLQHTVGIVFEVV